MAHVKSRKSPRRRIKSLSCYLPRMLVGYIEITVSSSHFLWKACNLCLGTHAHRDCRSAWLRSRNVRCLMTSTINTSKECVWHVSSSPSTSLIMSWFFTTLHPIVHRQTPLPHISVWPYPPRPLPQALRVHDGVGLPPALQERVRRSLRGRVRAPEANHPQSHGRQNPRHRDNQGLALW